MLFELVTPAKSLAKFEAVEVIIPGSEGSFGVLAGHQPLLSTLQEGHVRVKKEGEELTYKTGNGFVEVTPEKVTVLTDLAELVD